MKNVTQLFLDDSGHNSVGKIKKISVKNKTIAFFCPDASYRKNFGEVPDLLEKEGFVVLHLYGTRVGDDFESKPTSFYVGEGLLSSLDWIDLFITSTTMDVLPESSKKALLSHGSFAAFGPEAHENNNQDPFTEAPLEPQLAQKTVNAASDIAVAPESFQDRYEQAVAAKTHFTAFARLYDYYLVPTPDLMHVVISILSDHYRLPKIGQPRLPAVLAPDFQLFNSWYATNSKRLPDEISVIPVGYPQIDALIRKAEQFAGIKDVIVFAPTRCTLPVWEKYSALAHNGYEIVAALLREFPQYNIVFKPHPADFNEPMVKKISDEFCSHTNFKLDMSSSSYHELYARSALMISDFSSTAYTFALGTETPVVFYSAIEDDMPAALKEESYCAQRQDVGLIAKNIDELILNAKSLLTKEESAKFARSIENLRGKYLFFAGSSERRIVEVIKDILTNRRDDDWITFDNRERTSIPMPQKQIVAPPRLVTSIDKFNIVRFKNRLFAIHQNAGAIRLDDMGESELSGFVSSSSRLALLVKIFFSGCMEKTHVDETSPILIRSINSHNIVRFGKIYYALAHSLGPIKLESLGTEDLRQLPHSNWLPVLIARVKLSAFFKSGIKRG